MKTWRWALFCFASFPAICAAQSDFVRDQMHGTPPPHPTVLLTPYKNEETPIISVVGDVAQVEVNHKLHSVSRSASYQPIRGMTFAPGSVLVTGESAGSRFTSLTYYFSNGSQVSGGEWDKHSDYNAILTPSESHQDCYVAVLFFSADFLKGLDPLPHISVVFQHIGDLPAGKPKKLSMRFGYMDLDKTKNMTFFPLIFSHGQEIQSNHGELSAQFFRRLELMRHEKMIADYKAKNAGKDAPLKPYVRVMPKFPDQFDLTKLPALVHASFMVDEDGTVYSVQVEDPVDHEAEKAIHSALRGWLFFPRIKEGRPVRTMVRIPISLHPERPAASS